MTTLAEVARVFFVILALADLTVAVLMWRWLRAAGGWRMAPTFLRMGLFTSIVICVASSMIAVLSVAGIVHVELDPEAQFWLAVIALAMPSITSFVWVLIAFGMRR